MSSIVANLLDQAKKALDHPRSLFDTDFQPIFVTGVFGSGTTLVGEALYQNFLTGGYVNESPLLAPPGSALSLRRTSQFKDMGEYSESLFSSNDTSADDVRIDSIHIYRKYADWPKVAREIIDKAANTHLVRAQMLKEAFPGAKFVFVFRNPVNTIEGFRRKWPNVFQGAPISELCDFWMRAQELFIGQMDGFRDDVIGVAYDQLVENSGDVLKSVATACGLAERPSPLALRDRPDVRGKGLRNVVEGKIGIIAGDSWHENFSLSEEDVKFVEFRLTDFHDRLRVIFRT